MKKQWSFFGTISFLCVAAVTVGAIFAARLSTALCIAVVLSGATVWVYFFVRFRSIAYSDDGEKITVRGGVFIKRELVLPRTSILWHTTVKIGSVVLFSVLHTVSGSVTVFALLNYQI